MLVIKSIKQTVMLKYQTSRENMSIFLIITNLRGDT